MKVGGRPLGGRISGRVAELRNRLARARYFRGHGVHSPYIYNIVRNVFMRNSPLPGDGVLRQALLQAGMTPRRALQLQNLMIHCGYRSFGLDCADAELCIVTRKLSRAEVLALVSRAAALERTVVVLAPYEGVERQLLCRQIVAEHGSTTVDNRAYLLIFNNHLPKQHFRI